MIDPHELMELIPRGKENAVTAQELAILKDSTRRNISRMVHEARSDGYLILSGRQGYYLPKDMEEVTEFYKRSRKQAVSLLAVLKTARKIVKGSGYEVD